MTLLAWELSSLSMGGQFFAFQEDEFNILNLRLSTGLLLLA